jgi:hypothetical protein
MLMRRVEKKFREAAEKGVLCEITDNEGHIRIIAPLGEFYTQKNNKYFEVYQYSGYSSDKEKLPGFRHISEDNIKKIKPLEIKFQLPRAYNPYNTKVYHEWIWHLPKAEQMVGSNRQSPVSSRQ